MPSQPWILRNPKGYNTGSLCRFLFSRTISRLQPQALILTVSISYGYKDHQIHLENPEASRSTRRAEFDECSISDSGCNEPRHTRNLNQVTQPIALSEYIFLTALHRSKIHASTLTRGSYHATGHTSQLLPKTKSSVAKRCMKLVMATRRPCNLPWL